MSNWNDARHEHETELRYLERLLVDAQANARELERHINLHRERAAILDRLEAALTNATAFEAAMAGGETRTPKEQLSSAMCRWFIQPIPNLQKATYEELVAAGGLSMIHDRELRALIVRAEAERAESARLDITIPALQRAAAPLEDYREWYVRRDVDSSELFERTDCRFDIAAMRADPRMPSVIAQIYRNELNYQAFRTRELETVRAVEARLKAILDLPRDAAAWKGTP